MFHFCNFHFLVVSEFSGPNVSVLVTATALQNCICVSLIVLHIRVVLFIFMTGKYVKNCNYIVKLQLFLTVRCLYFRINILWYKFPSRAMGQAQVKLHLENMPTPVEYIFQFLRMLIQRDKYNNSSPCLSY